MTDRRRSTALLLPLPATAPGAFLLRERTPSSSSPGGQGAPGGADSAGSPGATDPAGAAGASDASGTSDTSHASDTPDTTDTADTADAPDTSGSSGTSGAPGSSSTSDSSDTSGSGGASGSSDPSGASDSSGGSDTPAASAPSAPSDGKRRRAHTPADKDNPFAPPPADAPDQEWRPRHPNGQGGNGGQEQSPQDEPTPAWGSQWSSRQPGRQSGGFGSRPGGRGQQGGQGGPGGGPGGLRWDPTDPAQRRARYALLSGMWSFFFVLFSLPEISLLLGALAIYWGISSLRAKPGAAKQTAAATTAAMEGRPAPAPGGPLGAPAGSVSTRPQTTAAIAGLITGSLALMMVAATFTVQIVYRDYFTCVDDALTQQAGKSCERLLPKELRPLLGTQQ
ncbi:hypothetical protein [Streptomyces chattanoogensis]|uniref:hypothetical protein n=1 Tax=Streptomyces chattanoogensis TaxID=66876 RepID=UPI0036941851